MARRYSRLTRSEERKNIRKAYVFTFLTIIALLALIFLGLPLVARFAAFLTDIRQSSEPIESSDTTPPMLPRLEPVPEYTNQFQVEIKGSTEPGATVVLILNNNQEEILSNKQGGFTYSFSLLDGENTISALSQDASGNKSRKTDIFKVTFDDEPPGLEITSPEDGNEYFGSKQRQVVIEGLTEKKARVNINDRLVVVEPDGTFAFATTLSEGQNDFAIKAEDKAGNKTEKSLTLHFSP